jgi:hypothetical protein
MSKMRTYKALLITVLLLLTKPLFSQVKLEKISVGNKNNIWGISKNGYPYQLTGDLSGPVSLVKKSNKKFKEIDVGIDGSIYGIGKDANKFWYWNGTSWEEKPVPRPTVQGSYLYYISIKEKNLGVGIDSYKHMFIWNGSKWRYKKTPAYLKLKRLFLGDDGTLIATTSNKKKHYFYRKILFDWVFKPFGIQVLFSYITPYKQRQLDFLTIGTKENLWGLDGTTVYKWDRNNWKQMPGAIKNISTSGKNGPTLGINTSDELCVWEEARNNWRKLQLR